jgi:thiosulfate/3-mercaptopyruvate sulfurtransferase
MSGAGGEDVTREELERRLGEETLIVLDVRSGAEYTGVSGALCDPRQGRIAGSRHLDVQELMQLSAPEIEARLGSPADREIVAYCHSGARSALAAQILRAAGYRARNYPGSWHEWSRDDSLPSETG